MNIQQSQFKQSISSAQINIRVVSVILMVQIITLISIKVVLPDIDFYSEVLLGTFFLIVIACPVIYFYVIKPLIIASNLVEKKLRDYQDTFEKRVSHRTRELEESDSHKSELLDSVTDAIIHVDDKKNIVMYNNKSERLFGYTGDEIIGKSLHEIIPINSNESHNKKFQRYLNSVKSNSKLKLRGIIQAKHKNGKVFPVEICMMKMDDNDLYSIIVNNISKRREYEHSLIKAKEKAEKSNRDKSSFLAYITHELRNPMQSILGFSDLGLKKIASASTDNLQKYFQSIHDSANRMLKLINDLLDMSKLEANKMQLEYGAVNLQVITEKCLSEVHSQLKDLKLRYKINVQEVIPVSICDKEKIHQVILNLLSNSIRFSPPSGLIRIDITSRLIVPDNKTTKAIPGIQLCVSDQGKGIAKDERKTIFNKYIQSKKNQHAGGTGLGLAISKEIIELHNGKIWVEDEIDEEGTILCFQIPVNAKNNN